MYELKFEAMELKAGTSKNKLAYRGYNQAGRKETKAPGIILGNLAALFRRVRKILNSREEYRIAFLVVLTLATTVVFYYPFLVKAEYIGLPFFKLEKNTFDVMYRHWDGPVYVVVAKTLYSIKESPLPHLQPEFYAAALVGYPLAIRLFSGMGYLNAMLFASILFAVLAVLIFYKILKKFNYTKQPFFLAALFTIFPPRWLINHSVGASEPMFIFFSLLAFYFYKKNDHPLAAVSAAVAAITRVVGGLLFPFFLVMMFFDKNSSKKWWVYLIIPLALVAHFAYYQIAYGDFLIYFKLNSVGIASTPFSVVYSSAARTPAPEFFIGLFGITALGIARAYRKDRALAFFALLLALPAVFLNLSDISRYVLPAMPFALLIGFEDILTSKEFKYVLPFLVLLTYLYAWTFTGAALDHLVPDDQWIPFARIVSTW